MGPIRAMLADAGVTEQQWRVLRVIEERGTTDATHIAEAACLLMPSLTRILQVLEAKEYCTRTPHPSDRRHSLIDITEKGRSLLASNLPEANRIFRELEAEFGKEKLENLLDLLNALVDSGEPDGT